MKKIGIIGSPGAGKTTLSAGLFYQLKIGGHHVELVPELIKFKVYQGLDFSKPGFDIQNTLEQLALEESVESAAGVGHSLDFLLCEAPLCNGYFYASFYDKRDECPVLKRIAKDKVNTYDLLIFVKRSESADYMQVGRKESQAAARNLEVHILDQLTDINVSVPVIEVDQTHSLNEILKLILSVKGA